MSFKEQDKIALSDDEMNQVIGGFSLDFLVAGTGGGMARTMEQTVIPGKGMQATTLEGRRQGAGLQGATLQGGKKLCLKCGATLSGPVCGKCGWSALTASGGSVML